MKLSGLYSNLDDKFTRIDFHDGLNVVLAEIRLPKSEKKDSHNLGKTTLGLLLDFCLCAKRSNDLFLFEHEDVFAEFVFYLELEVSPGSYLTIRRSVERPTKISLVRHSEPRADFTNAPSDQWDHWEQPFEKSKTILDGILDLSALSPWHFRKGLGYFLRTQRDYSDVFKLARFAGKHSEWKPYVAHVLGFDSKLLIDQYQAEEVIAERLSRRNILVAEMGETADDAGKVDGLLLLKRKEIRERQKLIDAFDFRRRDAAETKRIVNELDDEIATLNARRYRLAYAQRKIVLSLEEDKVLFDPDAAQELFGEAGVAFEGQLKKSFEQLIAFNRSITEERRQYLKEESMQIAAELEEVAKDLQRIGQERSTALESLGDTDVFKKYKTASDEIVELRADALALERRRDHLRRLQELDEEIAEYRRSLDAIHKDVASDFRNKSGAGEEEIYGRIRLYFSEIVNDVIDRQALINVTLNGENHPEFDAEILGEGGEVTSAGDGFTYKKLECVAYDLAVIRAHLGQGYPQFVFHDGIFESLDPRKQLELLKVMRTYSDLGIQHIITLIDSDTPIIAEGDAFNDAEIVLTLNDEGEAGRLFKMPAW
jgi:uncharacterized protein YydD (DUF2326 family)